MTSRDRSGLFGTVEIDLSRSWASTRTAHYYPEANERAAGAFENALFDMHHILDERPRAAVFVVELRASVEERDLLARTNGLTSGTRRRLDLSALDYIGVLLNWNHPALTVLEESVDGKLWRDRHAPLVQVGY
jgi:hypothetical protein